MFVNIIGRLNNETLIVEFVNNYHDRFIVSRTCKINEPSGIIFRSVRFR
jgi:hypothetical protein